MSYGRDEHRQALRVIEAVAREVETLRYNLGALRNDLLDDNAELSEPARKHLRSASQLLGRALADLDNAATELPTPVAVQWFHE